MNLSIVSTEMRHLQRLFLKGSQDRRLAILSVTQTCDLTCSYCRPANQNWYDRMALLSEAKVFHPDRWPELAQFCQERNVVEILLTGGEPTLYPHLKDFALFLHEAGIRFSFHTHGLYKGWPRLVDCMVERGIRPNIHLSSELFVEDQLQYRQSGMPYAFVGYAAQANLKVELKVVLHRGHLAKLDRLRPVIDAWIDKGICSMRFQPVTNTSVTIPDELTLDESAVPIFETLKGLLQETDEKYRRVIRNSAASFDATIRTLSGQDTSAFADACGMSSKIIFIDANFKLDNCQTLWKKNPQQSCREYFDLVCCGYQS